MTFSHWELNYPNGGITPVIIIAKISSVRPAKQYLIVCINITLFKRLKKIS